jgi:tetratricopeptide (TPR) repeat protein
LAGRFFVSLRDDYCRRSPARFSKLEQVLYGSAAHLVTSLLDSEAEDGVNSRFWCALCSLIVVSSLGGGCRNDPERAKQGHLQNGDRLVAARDYQAAIVEYRNAIRQDSHFGPARLQLARAYLAVNDKQRALAEFVRAADLMPNDAEAQLAAARVLIQAGRVEDAKTRAEIALKLDPKNADAHVLRGTATANLRDFEEALKAFEAALAAAPKSSDLYLNLGLFQRHSGNRKEAEASLMQALQLNPQSLEARMALVNLYWSSGRSNDVERLLHEAVELSPQDANVNRTVAIFFLMTDRPAMAEAPLRRAAESADSSRLLLADYLAAVGRQPEAVVELEKLVAIAETYAAATIRLAGIDRQRGAPQKAYERLNEAIAKTPGSLDLLAAQGRFLLADGNAEGALQAAGAALKAQPESWEAHELTAAALVAQRQSEAAFKEFNEALRLNPRALDAQIGLAQLNLERGKTQEAIRFAEEALQQQPTGDAARVILVRALLASGDPRRARAEIQPLERLSNSAAIHALLGQVEFARGDTTAARKAFDRALSLDAKSVDAVAGLVGLDLQSKKVAAAVDRLDGFLKLVPRNAEGFYLAARTYYAAGDLVKTEQALKTTLDLDASLRPAYDLLNRVYRQQGRVSDALQIFERVIQQRPTDVPAHIMIGVISEAEGKVAEAKKAYERALTVDPRAPLAANNLAYIFAEEGSELQRALSLAQTAKAQLPDDPDINDTLGWVYYKQNLPKQAVNTLEESVKKNPRNPLYQYHLGLAYLQGGDKGKARSALQAALKLQPNFTGAGEARKALSGL